MTINDRLTSPPPHLRGDYSTARSMRDVILAMVPIILVTIYFNGPQAISLIAVSVITAMITEVIFRKLMGKQPNLSDFSAVLTGLFVALVLPVAASPLRAIIATVIAVGIVKELMGGLGWNRFNPALFGYVATIFLGSWMGFQQVGVAEREVDTISGATPLTLMHQGAEMPGYGELLLFSANSGSLAEASALAVIIGGAYLLYRHQINWYIPGVILATVLVLSFAFGVDPIYSILSGGVLFGAFFMATDWVTCPINNRGKIIFALGVGILISLFRYVLPPTGGVAFSILIMNALTPLIEAQTKHPSFAEPRSKSETAS